MIKLVDVPSRLRNGIDPTFIIGRALAGQGVAINFDARVGGSRAIRISSEQDYQRFQALSDNPNVKALDHALYGYSESLIYGLALEVDKVEDKLLSRREKRQVLAYGYEQAAKKESNKVEIRLDGLPVTTVSQLYLDYAKKLLHGHFSINRRGIHIQLPVRALTDQSFGNIFTRVVDTVAAKQVTGK